VLLYNKPSSDAEDTFLKSSAFGEPALDEFIVVGD
jgi:hypothetical protein